VSQSGLTASGANVPAGLDLWMFMALAHAANAELRSGRAAEEDAHGALVATVLGAVDDDRSSR
jgi:hypothetical protein